MKLTDERIINYLKKKNGENFDLEKFINVSLEDLRDAKKFRDIDEITAKINAAILDGKKILIYGDYDCDGVCATAILYLFLKSKGANVDVFIPNRFENGYGISIDAIEEIVAEYYPDLIITVDLGITAIEEVEILKQEGIDIVVTDHHLPLSEVPNCLILDPKYNNEPYGFDSLCGAGVAMKLVEALGGRDEANKYLDIAAIATVGDIVPLVDENRIIAKVGIEKINKGECHKSISFMKSKLAIEKLNSIDISFKIVPRINACGRMDSAIKVFQFLVEDDEKILKQKYAEIENDNNLRLSCIEKGNVAIEKSMSTFNFEDPVIFVVGDFHEGIIGILASRVCNEYHKPCIVFTKTENGTLKGSGRSIEEIDLHKVIANFTDMLENFGGHKMAVGLEIEPNILEIFKSKVNLEIRRMVSNEVFLIKDKSFDIEINEDDISDYFYNQLSLLEPFGAENEKPSLAIKQMELNVQPISQKAFKHYRCYTNKNHSFIGFNFYNYVPILQSSSEKLIKIDLFENIFSGKTSISAQAKDIVLLKPKIDDFQNINDLQSSLFNLYYSIFDFNNKEKYHIVQNIEEIIQELIKKDEYGTAIIATTNEDIEVLKNLDLMHLCAAKPYKSCQNVAVISPKGIYSLDSVNGYKNIIFLSKYFENEHLYFSQKYNVYENKNSKIINEILDKNRNIFVKIYSLIKSNSQLKANDEIDFAKKLSIRENSLSANQILFAIIVFMELNFIEWDNNLNEMKILPAKKVELDKSKFYNEV